MEHNQSSAIRQINISFNTMEDRLLLRVLNAQQSEVRIWLARNMTQGLHRLLTQKLYPHWGQAAADRGEAVAPTPRDKQMLGELRGAQQAAKMNYDKTYEEPTQVSIELLATTANLNSDQSGTTALQLVDDRENQKKSISMKLDENMGASLIRLLEEGCHIAQWPLNTNALLQQTHEELGKVERPEGTLLN